MVIKVSNLRRAEEVHVTNINLRLERALEGRVGEVKEWNSLDKQLLNLLEKDMVGKE